jgi:hypothetical protein
MEQVMSEWSAVNIIDSEDVITLEDRWGVLDEILPLLARVKGIKPREFSADNMLMLRALTTNRDFDRINVHRLDGLPSLLEKQQDEMGYSYNLFLTKEGWELEVISNPGHVIYTVNGEENLGYISNIMTNRMAIVERMPLSKLTKTVIASAERAHKHESDRCHKLAVERHPEASQ